MCAHVCVWIWSMAVIKEFSSGKHWKAKQYYNGQRHTAQQAKQQKGDWEFSMWKKLKHREEEIQKRKRQWTQWVLQQQPQSLWFWLLSWFPILTLSWMPSFAIEGCTNLNSMKHCIMITALCVTVCVTAWKKASWPYSLQLIGMTTALCPK